MGKHKKKSDVWCDWLEKTNNLFKLLFPNSEMVVKFSGYGMIETLEDFADEDKEIYAKANKRNEHR